MKRVSILLLFTICFHCAFATVFHVSISGNDASGDGSAGNPWRTLRSAVTKVPAGQGHTIKLSAGTFVESGPFNVPPGVNVEGAGVDQTIIKAASSFYFNPASPGFAIDKFLMSLSSSSAANGNQSLKNFTLDGDGKKLHGGIYVKYRNNVLIQNVKVQGTNFCGIWIWDVKDSALRQVTLVNCSWGSTGWAAGALQLANLERIEIDRLNVDENSGYGIKALGSGGNRITNMKVFDSRISVNPAGKWNNGSAPNIAFELWEVYLVNCEIYNNYLDNHLSLVNVQTPPTGIQSVRVHHNIFDLLSRAGGHGYSIELSVNDAEIDHNWFNGGSYGIANWSPAYTANWLIHHNTFNSLSSGYPGEIIRSQLNGIHNVKVYNNTVEFTGNRTMNFLGLHKGQSDNIEIKNNLVINSNTGYSYWPNQLIFMEGGAAISGLKVEHNFLSNIPIGTTAGTFTNNLTGNPQINKTGARPTPYYLLTSNSPPIDKGVNVGFAFQGSAPDIGAHEYGASTIPPANKLPSVNLTSPANNANFSTGSAITLTATASDSDGSVSKVEFFNGTTKLGEDLTSPYSYVWSNVSAGSYSLTARATDNQSGVTTSSPVSVTVTNPNPPPVVTLTAPANNAVFSSGATVTISANATDANGTVSKVEFFNGAVKLGEDLVSPYSFIWSTIPNGSYAITAKATDNQGAVSTSTVVTINVTNGNNPPVVNLTSPASGATFSAGSSITITANASDNNGAINKVEFFNGSTKLGEDPTGPYSFAWPNVPAGSYTLTARATDNGGATTTSNQVSIVVNPSNIPPTVSLTAPSNNASFALGSSITLTASANDTNGSINKVEFYDGATKLGEDLTSPYSYVLNNASIGVHILTAKATDNLGATSSSSIITISVTNSNAPPKATLTGPSDNSYFLPGANITLTAAASDANGSVTKVEFFQGDTKLGEDLTSPYNFVWNNVPAGTYSLSARATDNQGATAISNLVDVIVTASTNSPSIVLTAPLDNSTFSSGSSILITANASTATGSVSKVEFFSGNTKLGEDLTSPYSFTWTSVPTGGYTLSAKATDDQAATVISAAVNIIVSPSPNAPVVDITSPENNSTFNSGTPVTITADASDPNGSVSRVEFYAGNDKLGEDTSSPYAFTWNNIPEGSYTISALATDNQGVTQVDQIQIFVGNNPSASAGEDITISLPTNSIQVAGSGVSSDGSTLLYSWNQLSGPNSASFNDANSNAPTLEGLVEGTYVIELTVTDSRGLTSSDQVMINVRYSESQGIIPRYFSPNDDGVNDLWEWPRIELYANSVLTVFNKSGQKIYEAVSYQNTWDGKLDGKPLQEDAYYYVIKLADSDNITGAVRIVR